MRVCHAGRHDIGRLPCDGPCGVRGGVSCCARHTRDVVDGGAALVLVDGVEADEVLLGVACHLSGGARDHKVARNATPVTFAEFCQSEEEQPAAQRAVRAIA